MTKVISLSENIASEKSIYYKLSLLPNDIADKITNAKTGGGRSLNAIWESDLTSDQKHVLMFFGSQLNFTENFEDQYRYMSLSTIAEKTSLSKRTVIRIINGDSRSNKKGLVELGYLKKELASEEKQKKGWSNEYCLTSKIFTEYMQKLADSALSKNNSSDGTKKVRPSVPLTPPQRPTDIPPVSHGHSPQCPTVTPPSVPRSHKVPCIQNPSSKTPSFFLGPKKFEELLKVEAYDLTEYIKARRGGLKFFNFNRSQSIIKNVMIKGRINLKKFQADFEDFRTWEYRDSFLDFAKAMPDEIETKLTQWCLNKKQIKKEFKNE